MAQKLTKDSVQQMRELYGKGATQGALARHFRVGVAQVGRIVRGEVWVEGAGERLPTQAEQDAVLGRLMQLQTRVLAQQRVEEEDPETVRLLKETLGGAERAQGGVSPPARAIPPSPLDGADVPDETEGEGQAGLIERAKAYGLDVDKLLKEGEGR